MKYAPYTPLVALCALSLSTGTLQAAGSIKVSASKKSGSSSKSNQQFIPGGASTRLISKDSYYAFKIRSMSPQTPPVVKIEWALIVEGIGGRNRVAKTGSDSIQLQFGRDVAYETEGVTLTTREFSTTRGVSKAKEELEGYALRIKDANDLVLAESFSSKSIEKAFKDFFVQDTIKKPLTDPGQNKLENFIKQQKINAQKRRFKRN